MQPSRPSTVCDAIQQLRANTIGSYCPGMARSRSISTLIWSVIGLASAVAFVGVFVYTPIAILARAMHDDGLFLRLGSSLASGRWLGDYNQYTLAKGPGYPIFLAINSWLGIPVSLSHSAFHCSAAAVFSGAIARTAKSQALGVMVFLVLLWNPLSLTLRVTREAVYTGQILAAHGLAAYSLFLTETRGRTIATAMGAGLLLGWCWLTREEGVLLVPGFLVLLLGAASAHRRDGARLRTVTVAALAALLTFLGVQAAFQLTNFARYGAFVGVDFKEKNFQAALRALQSVRTDDEMMFIPVPRSARHRIYEVSPAFATLEGYLDAPSGSPWQNGCEYWEWTCGDISGVWFVWALRDAAATRGHYRSPVAASQFFERIADEVESACRRGQLRCEESWIPYMPRSTRQQLSWIPGRIVEALRYVTSSYAPALENMESTGDRTAMANAVAFLNFPLHTPSEDHPPHHVLEGWYFDGTTAWFDAEAVTSDGKSTPVSVQRKASPDLVTRFHDPSATHQRYSIEMACKADCRVVFISTKNERREIAVAELLKGANSFSLGSGTLRVDATRNLDERVGPEDTHRIEIAHRVRAVQIETFQKLVPSLVLVGCLAFAGAVAWLLRFPSPGPSQRVSLLAGSLWVMVAVRTVAIALIDVSSFPAIDGVYLQPATYVAPAAAILSIWALFAAICERSGSPSAPSERAA